jgi:uncharacterized repeat protein (TIGR01451 family)
MKQFLLFVLFFSIFNISYSQVTNYRIDGATYIGASFDNSVGVAISNRNKVIVAGNFNTIQGRKASDFVALFGAGATSQNERGKIVVLNSTIDTLLATLALGSQIFDFEIQNHGEKKMVVTGNWGVSLLDSTGLNILWTKTIAELNALGLETDKHSSFSNVVIADIADNGNVVIARGTKKSNTRNDIVFGAYGIVNEDKVGFIVLDKNGNQLCQNTVVVAPRGFMDITISGDTVFVAYQIMRHFALDPAVAMPECHTAGYIGMPIQQPVLKAFVLNGTSNSMQEIWQTWGFTDNHLYDDVADAMARKLNVGADGNLLFLGSCAGPNSVYRWNGKTTKSKRFSEEGICEPNTTLITTDYFNTPVNSGAAHLGYYAVINKSNGEVSKGQYLIPRLSNLTSNNANFTEGYIHSDFQGNIYVAHKSMFQLENRMNMFINGNPIGDYKGGDYALLVVSPDFLTRKMWATFSDSSSFGSAQAIAVNNNRVAVYGNAWKDMMTCASRTEQNGKTYCYPERALSKINTNYADTFATYLVTWFTNEFESNIPPTKKFIISGNVFFDKDSNKIINGTDHGFNNHKVILLPNNISVFTDKYGNYRFRVDSGTYTVKYELKNNWVLTTDSLQYTLNLSSTSKYNINFGVMPKGMAQSAVNLYLYTRARCLTEMPFYIDLNNVGFKKENGHLIIKAGNNLKLSKPNFVADTVSGDSSRWVWKVSNLEVGQYLQLKMMAWVPGNPFIGDYVTIEAEYINESGFTKYITINVLISCAWDPNDKLVSPEGQLDSNYVLMSDSLIYTIRFQNTGNDTAYHVFLKDTLDSKLDLNTFEVLSGSHNFITTLTAEGYLDFSFYNIMLPDSTTDNPNSNGYVSYKIKPKSSISNNTKVYNKAHIYFDYNDAVETNQTKSTFVIEMPTFIKPIEIDNFVLIYPNPSRDFIVVESETSLSLIEIINMEGKIVKTYWPKGDRTCHVKVDMLKKGIYVIKISNQTETKSVKVIIE